MVKAVSLATQVYEEIRRSITEGRFEEGAPLVIAQLAGEFGVSHTPVREALARLLAEGLVTFVTNVGFRVAEAPRSVDYANWMQARLILEVETARIGAAKATEADIQELEAINARIREAPIGADLAGVRLFSDLNAAFHRRLITLSRNPFLLKAYDQIWLGPQFSRNLYRDGVDRLAIADEHAAIIAALRRRDVDGVCRALERHIVDSLARDESRHAEADGTAKATGSDEARPAPHEAPRRKSARPKALSLE